MFKAAKFHWSALELANFQHILFFNTYSFVYFCFHFLSYLFCLWYYFKLQKRGHKPVHVMCVLYLSICIFQTTATNCYKSGRTSSVHVFMSLFSHSMMVSMGNRFLDDNLWTHSKCKNLLAIVHYYLIIQPGLSGFTLKAIIQSCFKWFHIKGNHSVLFEVVSH